MIPQVEMSRGAHDFVAVCRCLLQADGPYAAWHLADRSPDVSSRAAAILKAAVEAATLDTSALAPDFQSVSTAFMQSLRWQSAFERMLPSMRRVPWLGRHVATTANTSGSEVEESAPKPISRLQVDEGTLNRSKAVAIVAMSKELAQWAGPGSNEFVAAELRGGVADAVDSVFLDGLLDSITPVTSTGSRKGDLRALLGAVRLHAAMRLYWVGSPDVAAALSVQQLDGLPGPVPIAPAGELLGRPFAVTDYFSPGSPATGSLALIDASQLLAADGGVRIDSAEHAAIQLDDDPDGGATNLTSLWQTNAVAIKVERRFAFSRPRPAAVAIVDGIVWGGDD